MLEPSERTLIIWRAPELYVLTFGSWITTISDHNLQGQTNKQNPHCDLKKKKSNVIYHPGVEGDRQATSARTPQEMGSSPKAQFKFCP